MNADRAGPIARLLAEAGLVTTILWALLAGWRRDFRVPLAFSQDALEYLMQVKGTIENGWWWVHPRLSAPGEFKEVLYPSNTNVDQAIVWIVHLFTKEPGLVINVSWILMVALSAVIAGRCLTVLGVARRAAVATGILFALSPYALARNIDHFSLAIYLVPIPCTVALVVATGRWQQLGRHQRWILTAGCLLLGLNYPYYAFFGSFLIVVASVVAYGTARGGRESLRGIALVALIATATALNLSPSVYAWSRDGRPTAIPEKHAAEAEQYGLKLRHLVSPVFDHSFPPFRDWLEREERANYPLETENRNARLGLVATIGFVALVAAFFVPAIAAAAADGELFVNAGRLTLAAVLLATVGGFGSLFNLLVSPEIRAYARITPFIAFFSLAAVALFAARLLTTRARWAPAALAAALVVGVYDQGQATRSINQEQNDIRAEWTALRTFVGALENRIPAGAMVFELPVLTFQSEAGRERMTANDELKPYIVSRTARWSFPAMSNAIVRWQQQVGRLPPTMLATALAREKFDAILVDRYGYADGGQSLLSALGATSAPDALLAKSDRYVAVDLARVRKADVAADRLPRLGATTTPATRGVPLCAGVTSSNIDWVNGSSRPARSQAIRVASSGDLSLSGWAIDERSRSVAGDVDLVVGGDIFPADYGSDRPDVARYFGVADAMTSGFTFKLPAADVGAGIASVSLRILSTDRSCYYQGAEVKLTRSSE